VNEDKAARYQRLRRWASVVSLAWSAGLLVVLVLTGGSLVLRDAAGGLARLTGVPDSLAPSAVVALYVFLLSVLHELGSFPIDACGGFALERRYGLATERFGRWLRDRAKASLIGLALGSAGAIIAYAALRSSPERWWVAAAAVFSLAAVTLTMVGPVVLLPLFYRCEPLEREPLRARLIRLAARAGVPAIGVYEWHLSDRTRKANAALAGLGATRRILVSDTLLSEYTEDEIEVVLAHEVAHHVHGDIWKGVITEVGLTFGAFFLASRALAHAVPRLDLEDAADVAGLPVLLLAAIVLAVAVLPVMNALSRAYESRADRFALDLTGNPAAFTSAMRRLAFQNLAEPHPSRLTRWLFSSHPPIEHRLEMASRWSGASSA
jgi:STE24 endopeptidase